jgi:drug/metabolite transporter (DMT)-like permease
MTDAPPSPTAGWLNGLAGMLIFSASLPATRVAVADLDPFFLTAARAAIAGLVGAALLAALRERRPARADLRALAIVAGGVVIGFPLLTALALLSIPAAHAVVFTGLLPLATALFAVLRAGERPPLPFWLAALCGGGTVAGYALVREGAAEGGHWLGDLLMVGAVLVCGLGYAEGARLSRRLGGWQVISWALALSLPVTLPLALAWNPASWAGVGGPALLALAYVSLFSMLIGFVFWYRGLAQGGIAAVGQLQLLQPFFGFALAAALLGEPIGLDLVAVAAVVVACVAAARRFAAAPAPR